jgi:hypothetical protein
MRPGPMRKKLTIQVLAALFAVILTGFIIWRTVYRKIHVLGAMSTEDAEEIFTRTKISNCAENIERVTGEVFFGYLNSYLRNMSFDAAKSLATIEPDEKRGIGGVSAMVAVQAAHRKMFVLSRPRENIQSILEHPRVDSLVRIEEQTLDSIFAVFGDVLIYKLLKEQAKCDAYNAFENKSDTPVRRLIEECGRYGELKVEVQCRQGSRCMCLYEFIQLEIYFTCQFFISRVKLINTLRYYRSFLPF